MTTATHRTADRRAAKNRRAGVGLRTKSAGNATTRLAFAEADSDYRHFVETGHHLLPAYKTLEGLFASWK